MGLYEKLKDLAHMLGDYLGTWGVREGITNNDTIIQEIMNNYTLDEIAEAHRILLKQVAESL